MSEHARGGVDVPADRTLELDARAMRELVAAAVDRIVPYLARVDEQPAGYDLAAEERVRALRSPMREEGTGIGSLLTVVFDRALPDSFNTAAASYMAYVPGGGLFASAVADLIADSLNRYTGVWLAAPGFVELEMEVLRWFAEVMGYPSAARGILTTGASLAHLTGLVTARRERLGEDFADAVIYVGDQTHHSVRKAAMVAGFPAAAVVAIPSDERFRMRLDALSAAVARDRAAGRRPFLVVASSGTTNTGAVDPLAAVADLAAAEGLWMHVDAAYGGFFRLTAEGRRRLDGIERADSIVLDPHKGLFLPFGTGALLVRDGPALRRAHTVHADYMPALREESGEAPFIDFCEHGPELTRDFRGLRVWLPLRLHGVAPFRRNLDEKLALAARAAARLAAIPGIEIVAEPQLSVVAFRYVRAGCDEAELERLNRALLAAVLASGRVWLNGTEVAGHYVLRICVLHFRTHQDRVDECVDLIAGGAAELAGS